MRKKDKHEGKEEHMAEDMTAIHAMSDITTGTATVMTELLRLLNCLMTDLSGRSWAFEQDMKNDPSAGFRILGAYVRKGGALKSDTIEKADEHIFEELLRKYHIPYICNTVREEISGQKGEYRELCIFTTRDSDEPLLSDIRSQYLKAAEERLKNEELERARLRQEKKNKTEPDVSTQESIYEEPEEELSFDRR